MLTSSSSVAKVTTRSSHAAILLTFQLPSTEFSEKVLVMERLHSFSFLQTVVWHTGLRSEAQANIMCEINTYKCKYIYIYVYRCISICIISRAAERAFSLISTGLHCKKVSKVYQDRICAPKNEDKPLALRRRIGSPALSISQKRLCI